MTIEPIALFGLAAIIAASAKLIWSFRRSKH